MDIHEYKNIWTPAENETLNTRMEPENKIDKFAVAVVGGRGEVVGHLMKGKTGRFAKTVFYFLTGKAVLIQRKWNNMEEGYAFELMVCRLIITTVQKMFWRK